jgi:hypothetical protein
MILKEHPIALLRRSWPALLFGGLVGALLAALLSFIQPLEHSSTVRLLITQPGATNTDPYTILKSNERIAQNLSQLLYTSSFFENILTQAEGVDRDFFPVDEYDRRRAWGRSIGTTVEPGSGLMLVTIFHPSRDQAHALVQAATQELAKQAPNFFGYSVRVQVIDAPLDSRWIARPNFLNNALAGLILGALLGLLWMVANREKI